VREARVTIKTIALSAGLLIAGASTPSHALRAQSVSYRQRIDTTVTLERGGTLSVSVYSGRVSVVGGSGSDVRIRGTSDRNDLEVRARSTSVSVQSEPEGPHGGRAELDIVVPFGTRVVLNGFSAPFSVRGAKGEVNVESLSGDVIVSDAVGRVSVETVSGNINVDRVDGDVGAEAVSGRIGLTNIKGDIETESVSGRLTMTGAQANSVRAETVSGSVSYDGTFNETGNYTFKTHSGLLTLALPANAGATVSMETFSGNVDSDFPVTMETARGQSGHESKFEFKIGNGRSRIVTETFSGDIRIQRGTNSPTRE
jgi:hypothetical protein